MWLRSWEHRLARKCFFTKTRDLESCCLCSGISYGIYLCIYTWSLVFWLSYGFFGVVFFFSKITFKKYVQVIGEWEWLDELTIVRSLVDNRLVIIGVIMSWSLSIDWLLIKCLVVNWPLIGYCLITSWCPTIYRSLTDHRLIIVWPLIDQWSWR